MSAGEDPPQAAQRCANCSHFLNAPESLEAQIPGLKVMGSGYSAVRADDGLCALHDRYLSADHRCASGAWWAAEARMRAKSNEGEVQSARLIRNPGAQEYDTVLDVKHKQHLVRPA